MILRLPETQRCRDACGSGLHGIRADPSPAQELPRAFECPKPFLERRQDSDDDVLLCPERRRRIWRLLAKPKQARNFKDLKHLKCRYTFRIRASKWNPIEHHLSSEISNNWAAEPLDSYPKVLNFVRNTCTRTGLTVAAYLDRRRYPTAQGSFRHASETACSQLLAVQRDGASLLQLVERGGTWTARPEAPASCWA